MKNMGAGVDAIIPREKKEAEEGEIEEEEYTEHENTMYFFLKERPEYRISAVGRWLESSKGKVIGDVDTYFRHILTGQRCETAWTTCIGWCDEDERTEEIWETLCMRIQNTDGLEQIICDEESFGV